MLACHTMLVFSIWAGSMERHLLSTAVSAVSSGPAIVYCISYARDAQLDRVEDEVRIQMQDREVCVGRSGLRDHIDTDILVKGGIGKGK